MNDNAQSVAVVISAHNEESTIASVIDNWLAVVNRLGPDSFLLILDDGSTDRTGAICREKLSAHSRLRYLHQDNRGIGHALIAAYTAACAQPVDFVFQTDADDQTVSEEFWSLWPHRHTADLVIGHRRQRGDGILRRLLSGVLRITVSLIFGRNIPDANVPFRLMDKSCLQEWLKFLPASPFITNAMLAILAVRSDSKVRWVPIQFRPREAGESFFRVSRIPRIASRCLYDLTMLKLRT